MPEGHSIEMARIDEIAKETEQLKQWQKERSPVTVIRDSGQTVHATVIEFGPMWVTVSYEADGRRATKSVLRDLLFAWQNETSKP